MKYISMIVVLLYVLMSGCRLNADAYFCSAARNQQTNYNIPHFQNNYPYSRSFRSYNRRIAETAAQLKKQQNAAKEIQKTKYQKIAPDQEKYRHDLGFLEHELISREVKEAHHQARLHALREILYNNSRTARSFALSRDVRTFAQGYDIPTNSLSRAVCNAYEFQLHTEFLEQLQQATALKPLYIHTREHDVFLDIVGHSVAFGVQANRNNDAVTAMYWSDIAWKSLDLASAVAEGLALGVYNTAAFVGNAIQHPVETLKTVVHGAASVVGMLAQVTGAILRFSSFAYGATADKQAELRYYEQLEAELDEFVDQMDCVIGHCSDQLAKMPLREKVKHVTAFGAEFIIPGKAFKVVHNVCLRMRPVAIGLFHALRDEQKAVQVAARVEGIAGNVGMRVVEGAQEVATTAKVVLSEAQLLLQNFHGDLMKKLEPEIAILRSIFDNKIKGFGEFSNKYLKIDYEHIFGMNLSFSKRGVPQIGGFHHDLMSAVKKSNRLEFVDEIMHASGAYKAKVLHKGNLVKEITFFPAHWPREKVVSTIYDVYDNFIKSGVIPTLEADGKYSIQGFSKDGVEIIMFITKKGVIKTVYPILK